VSRKSILYIEPFHGGSHAAYTRTLTEKIDAEWTCLTLPGRHWKWRARGSAVYFAQRNQEELAGQYDVLWASSFLDLSALVALCPNLTVTCKVLYFHENQLAYPSRPEFTGERDIHFGLTQMISALVADRCVFNSQWNLDSFLSAGSSLLKRMPDAVPPGWIEAIREKSMVLGVPLDLPAVDLTPGRGLGQRSEGPLILWNHRWEHDKAPDVFFGALEVLKKRGVPFRLAVCGERYARAPKAFDQALLSLEDRIIHWGFLDSKDAYQALLLKSDIAVSTAQHEFFGIAMLEATHFGARPLVPDRLSYRELFPAEYRYPDDQALLVELTRLIDLWVDGQELRADRRSLTLPYGAQLLKRYAEFIVEAAQLYPEGQFALE
jgi:glycosyltransferase involved in cell wall biosynthesis